MINFRTVRNLTVNQLFAVFTVDVSVKQLQKFMLYLQTLSSQVSETQHLDEMMEIQNMTKKPHLSQVRRVSLIQFFKEIYL